MSTVRKQEIRRITTHQLREMKSRGEKIAMLTALSVRDIVLIEKLDLTLEQGLTVLTGETGAGKSILLDALGLALGARGDSGLVRSGAEKGVVTAAFDLKADHEARRILEEEGIEADGEKAVHLADPLGQRIIHLFLVQEPDVEFETVGLGKAAQHVENIVIKSADIAGRPFGGHECEDFLALQRDAAGLVRNRSQRITELRGHPQNLGLDRRADTFLSRKNARDGADGNAGALGDIRLARAADVGRIVHIVSCACKKF